MNITTKKAVVTTLLTAGALSLAITAPAAMAAGSPSHSWAPPVATGHVKRHNDHSKSAYRKAEHSASAGYAFTHRTYTVTPQWSHGYNSYTKFTMKAPRVDGHQTKIVRGYFTGHNTQSSYWIVTGTKINKHSDTYTVHVEFPGSQGSAGKLHLHVQSTI